MTGTRLAPLKWGRHPTDDELFESQVRGEMGDAALPCPRHGKRRAVRIGTGPTAWTGYRCCGQPVTAQPLTTP